MTTVLLIGTLVFLMMFGLPVGFGIELSPIIFLYKTQMKDMIVVAQRMFMGMNNFTLLAIPLFTLSGYLMDSGGLSKRLVDWVNKFFGGIWGSMGTVTIVCCTIFAALTGSGGATVVAIGALMIPAMKANGYPKEAAAGLLAAGGALGPIVPPSIAMIVYGTTMNLSIPKMFVASIIPGLLIAVAYIFVNTIYAIRHNIRPIKVKYSTKEMVTSTISASGVLLLPVIILGGIYGGIFTPTEAAAICTIYSIALGLIYRELTLKSLIAALKKTVETSAMVMLIGGSAQILGWVLAAAQIPSKIASMLLPYMNSQFTYWVMLLMIVFIVGCIMETVASIVILAPILVPIGTALGIDPLHLGVTFCICLIVGFITPPFGNNLFIASAVAEVSFTEVLKGVWPYLLVIIAITILLAAVPGICLWLPSLM